jgi:hypothetical protein
MRDEIMALVLAAKAAGMSTVTPEQLLFDLQKAGYNVDKEELQLVLKNIPGVSTSTPQKINFAKTTPDEKQEKKDDGMIKKMSRSTLDRKI